MTAELRRDPGTDGPPFSRDSMLRHKVHEVETEMNKKLSDQHAPFPATKYTHTATTTTTTTITQTLRTMEEKMDTPISNTLYLSPVSKKEKKKR